MLDFPVHAHTRHDGHAHPHLHEPFDAFDGRHLDGHVQGRAIPGEEFDHAPAIGGLDDVRDEIFASQFRDVDLSFFRQRVLRRHHQRELVFEDLGSLELPFPRHKGDCTQVQTVVQHLVRDIAGKHAVDAQVHTRMLLPKFGERGKKGVNREFVYTQRELPALQPL